MVLHEFVHQAQLEGGRGPVGGAGQQHVVQGAVQSQQPHRAHDPAASGQQAEGDLGEADPDVGSVDQDAVVAGEGELQAATESGPVEGGDHRHPEGLQATQLGLDAGGERCHGPGVIGPGGVQKVQGRHRRGRWASRR